jgi:chromosome segregation ATPase
MDDNEIIRVLRILQESPIPNQREACRWAIDAVEQRSLHGAGSADCTSTQRQNGRAAEPTDEDLKRHIRDKDRYRELLGRAEAEIERLKSLSDGLARAAATLVADNSTLQTELTELAAEIERPKAQLSGVGMQEFRRLEGRLHNAQAEIERLNAALWMTKQDADKAEAEIASLRTQVKLDGTCLAARQAEIERLREVWRLAEKQVETLLRQKSELQIEIERLKASRAGFEGRLAAAQLEIERLKAEIKRPEAEPAAAHNPYDLYDRAEDGRRIPRTGGE